MPSGYDPDGKVWHDGEIIITARSPDAAYRAFNLFLSAIAVYDYAVLWLPEPFQVEYLIVEGSGERRPFATSKPGFELAKSRQARVEGAIFAMLSISCI